MKKLKVAATLFLILMVLLNLYGCGGSAVHKKKEALPKTHFVRENKMLPSSLIKTANYATKMVRTIDKNKIKMEKIAIPLPAHCSPSEDGFSVYKNTILFFGEIEIPLYGGMPNTAKNLYTYDTETKHLTRVMSIDDGFDARDYSFVNSNWLVCAERSANDRVKVYAINRKTGKREIILDEENLGAENKPVSPAYYTQVFALSGNDIFVYHCALKSNLEAANNTAKNTLYTINLKTLQRKTILTLSGNFSDASVTKVIPDSSSVLITYLEKHTTKKETLHFCLYAPSENMLKEILQIPDTPCSMPVSMSKNAVLFPVPSSKINYSEMVAPISRSGIDLSKAKILIKTLPRLTNICFAQRNEQSNYIVWETADYRLKKPKIDVSILNTERGTLNVIKFDGWCGGITFAGKDRIIIERGAIKADTARTGAAKADTDRTGKKHFLIFYIIPIKENGF